MKVQTCDIQPFWEPKCYLPLSN